MAEQWLAAPVLGDEGEQAMLDAVPFAGSGRQVANRNGDPEFVGQDLQLALPQSHAHAIAAAAIGGDQQPSGAGITRAAAVVAPAPAALQGGGSGVVGDGVIYP